MLNIRAARNGAFTKKIIFILNKNLFFRMFIKALYGTILKDFKSK
jgi:hypothetical protein